MNRLEKSKALIGSAIFNAHLQWWRQSKAYRYFVTQLIDFPDKITEMQLWPLADKKSGGDGN